MLALVCLQGHVLPVGKGVLSWGLSPDTRVNEHPASRMQSHYSAQSVHAGATQLR